ncbi:hypothetical protein [Ornithinicoccus halotolerans]|uniref:hypothetical protein n=1 Tax=Ornithinicoccus halotolerans TaxID=1748220 RepID=UPI001294AD8D|nr:hypothetical protein [Ornithinicoccus halotolerans]
MTFSRSARRQQLAGRIAAGQGGVVHRAQLRDVGIDRWAVRNEVAGGRWSVLGRHTVAVTGPASWPAPERGPADWPARAFWAVWESGSGAVLDGPSALQAAGLVRVEERRLHVTVPSGAPRVDLPGVRRHQTRQVVRAPGQRLPRAPTEVAVLNAAEWARTDRQAALYVVSSVQQGLVAPDRLLRAWSRRRRSRRRRLVDAVVRDACEGAQALGELDFAALCRRYRLPAPTRQVVRRGRRGRVYLDVLWEELGIAVEVEGAQHTWGLAAVDDALRQNDLMIADVVVLRLPVLGLRLQPEAFMQQVARALRVAAQRRIGMVG